MGKKIRVEFEYQDGLAEGMKKIFPYEKIKHFLLAVPTITVITRMTEHDISEGPTEMIECTEIVHKRIDINED